MDTCIRYLNFAILLLFTLCYSYQAVFVLIRWFGKKKKYQAKTQHRYAVIISARNERAVIGGLLGQHSPAELPVGAGGYLCCGR